MTNIFTEGSKVEVLEEEEDNGGVFYSATVIKSPPSSKNGSSRKKNSTSKQKLYVEYHHLLAYEGGSELLREYVDSSKVRPEPPAFEERVEGYEVGEVVDAWYNDGWWTGVVTELVEGRRAVVVFDRPPDVREFGASELRRHLRWIGGTWIRPEKQDVSILPSYNHDDGVDQHDQALKNPEFNIAPSSTNNLSEKSTPDKQKKSRHVSTRLMKRCRRPLLLEKLKERGGDVSGPIRRDQIDQLITEISSDVMIEDQSADNHQPWRKTFRRTQSKVGAAQAVDEKINSSSTTIRRNREKMLQPQYTEVNIGGKKRPVQDVENKLARKEPELQVIVGLPFVDMFTSSTYGKSRAKKTSDSNCKDSKNLFSDKEHKSNNSRTQEVKDVMSLQTDFVYRRRRGNPQTNLFDSLQSPVTGNAINGDMNLNQEGGLMIQREVSLTNQENVALDMDTFLEDHLTPLCKRRHNDWNFSPETMIGVYNSPANKDDESFDLEALIEEYNSPDNRHDEIFNPDALTGLFNSPANRRDESTDPKALIHKRGNPSKSQKISPRVQDHPKASEERMNEQNCGIEVERVVTEGRSVDSGNGPLSSKCIKEIQSPPIIDVQRLIWVKTEDELMKNDKDHRDGDVLEDDNGDKLDFSHQAVASEDEVSVVPFIKNNDIWKPFESMESFKKTPQNPHFKPLERFARHLRQGIAIGLMVAFDSVVKDTLKLHLKYDKSIVDDILVTLYELETHGFDVGFIHDRVSAFLASKDRQCSYKEELNQLNGKMLEYEGAKTRIHEEKIMILEEIEETKKRLELLHAKLLVSESEKVKEDEKIAYLQARARETELGIKILVHDFEASSLW